jgi:hypothetical protein
MLHTKQYYFKTERGIQNSHTFKSDQLRETMEIKMSLMYNFFL